MSATATNGTTTRQRTSGQIATALGHAQNRLDAAKDDVARLKVEHQEARNREKAAKQEKAIARSAKGR